MRAGQEENEPREVTAKPILKKFEYREVTAKLVPKKNEHKKGP